MFLVSRVKVNNYVSGAHTSVPATVRTRNSAFHDHFDEATVTNPNPTTKKTNEVNQISTNLIWRASILRFLMKFNVSEYSENFLCSFYWYCYVGLDDKAKSVLAKKQQNDPAPDMEAMKEEFNDSQLCLQRPW